jgi:hypothetical protein
MRDPKTRALPLGYSPALRPITPRNEFGFTLHASEKSKYFNIGIGLVFANDESKKLEPAMFRIDFSFDPGKSYHIAWRENGIIVPIHCYIQRKCAAAAGARL